MIERGDAVHFRSAVANVVGKKAVIQLLEQSEETKAVQCLSTLSTNGLVAVQTSSKLPVKSNLWAWF